MTWYERAALLGTLLLAAGCGRPPDGFALRPLVGEKSYAVADGSDVPAGLSFRKAPELRSLSLDDETRPVVLIAPGTWRWRGRIQDAGAHLHAGVQLLPAAWKVVKGLTVTLEARDGDGREILAYRNQDTADRWIDLDADLGRWAGRTVTLEMTAEIQGLPAEHRDSNIVAWGPVSLSTVPEGADHPNVLFILVDTLRRDHTTPYGYGRDTTPEIQRRIAEPGAVVEEAYSQAPWTLPSVIALMTGRYPGSILGSDLATFGIPDEVEPMAEMFSRLGYQTGGFVANPTVHAGAGFARGFHTYYVPPADVKYLSLHGDVVTGHALAWLAANQDRPFFAYVHYIDPHDPYQNPDMEALGGRSPFMKGYDGPVAGDWIHGIYTGRIQLADPARDIPYIRALYDSEVRYADRCIGKLLASLDPKVLANTIVVLTADHGEELYDHGGWKHGQTLYEEQIHVPLIVRWDGHIRPGTKLRGTVRLLDLMPTLAHAAGGKPDPAWDGVDLLPALTDGKPVPRRPAFAQHLTSGPLRAAAVLDGRKLILYNEREPFEPADELQAHLYAVDQARFQREELYDLRADPGEKDNLIGRTAEELAPVIQRRLEDHLPGLWVLTDAALRPGSRLSGTITFERAPRRAVPYFLDKMDRLELTGDRLTFELTAERLAKGFRIEGDARIAAVELSVDGRSLPPSRGSVPGFLKIWVPQRKTVEPRAADPETERRLRSLGYIH